MNPFLEYLWPVAAISLMIGVLAGRIGFRLPPNPNKDKLAPEPPFTRKQMHKRLRTLGVGALAFIAVTMLWHWPAGGADRYVAEIDRTARKALDDYEMPRVTAHLHHGPLTRRLVLVGPAELDDFQTAELARIMTTLPGASRAQWSEKPAGTPLLIEALGAALAGYLLGMLVAYLVELRRRHNAQWTW